MISYYFQIVLIAFTFGFGIGTAMYVLSIMTMDKLKYLAKREVRSVIREEIIGGADNHR